MRKFRTKFSRREMDKREGSIALILFFIVMLILIVAMADYKKDVSPLKMSVAMISLSLLMAMLLVLLVIVWFRYDLVEFYCSDDFSSKYAMVGIVTFGILFILFMVSFDAVIISRDPVIVETNQLKKEVVKIQKEGNKILTTIGSRFEKLEADLAKEKLRSRREHRRRHHRRYR